MQSGVLPLATQSASPPQILAHLPAMQARPVSHSEESAQLAPTACWAVPFCGSQSVAYPAAGPEPLVIVQVRPWPPHTPASVELSAHCAVHTPIAWSGEASVVPLLPATTWATQSEAAPQDEAPLIEHKGLQTPASVAAPELGPTYTQTLPVPHSSRGLLVRKWHEAPLTSGLAPAIGGTQARPPVVSAPLFDR